MTIIGKSWEYGLQAQDKRIPVYQKKLAWPYHLLSFFKTSIFQHSLRISNHNFPCGLKMHDRTNIWFAIEFSCIVGTFFSRFQMWHRSEKIDATRGVEITQRKRVMQQQSKLSLHSHSHFIPNIFSTWFECSNFKMTSPYWNTCHPQVLEKLHCMDM